MHSAQIQHTPKHKGHYGHFLKNKTQMKQTKKM